MPTAPVSAEPTPKPRAFVFFDGQNLFHGAQREFAAPHPDFDPFLLANLVCNQRGWDLRPVRFYTGLPTEQQNRTWSVSWANKTAAMKRSGIEVVTRKLNYKTISIRLYEGGKIYLPANRDREGAGGACTRSLMVAVRWNGPAPHSRLPDFTLSSSFFFCSSVSW